MKLIFDNKYRPTYATMLAVVAFVWCCDIASRAGVISTDARHSLQFLGFLVMGLSVAHTVFFHEALRSFRTFFFGAMICGLGLLAIPVFVSPTARQGVGYDLMERFMAYGWYSAPFFILNFYVRSFERMQESLESTVQERTSRLTEANHQLQKEICEKMLISNELEYAKMDLEAALEKKTRELQDIEQQVLRRERLAALAHIASGVSHELNNTLSPIVSYSSMLLEKSILTDEQYDWVERISTAGESAIRVVNNLQQFHYKSTGASFFPVSPGAVVEKVVESTQPVWLSLNSSPHRTLKMESQIDSKQKVYADFSQLAQLICNLVMNAVDSMAPDQDGTVTISTRDETGAVVFEVRDNGRGMGTHEVERCFEPFFTTKHKRTGLGLSACYGIAKRHGGTIDVTSTPGQGTTFAVRIPHANEVDARAEADAPSAIAPQATVKAKPKKFDNVSILLVEDDETVRIAMTDLLHSIGASVNSVNNGPSAIELLKTNDSFDILITDLLMEEMDGVELLEECRQFSDVPVVMMSGWPRRRVNERLEGKPKPDAILSKPCKFGDIVRTLEEHAFKRKAVVGRS